jgi:Flp pilus assembly protein TadD
MSLNRADAEACLLEGNRHLQSGYAAQAESSFREALRWNSNFAEALSNLGLLRENAGDMTEAEELHRRALALRPDAVQIHLNLGVLLMNGGRFVESEAVYRQALSVAPDSATAWSNLGVLLAGMKREAEAEHCHRMSMALDPRYANARFNLSYILLRQGRFTEGFELLEARDGYNVLADHFTFPRWRGESLAGKSMAIGFEAGHGDMIQFCRYAAELKSRGAQRVSVVCHPGLVSLFQTLSGVDEVFSIHEDIPERGWDFWTPPLSLPHHFQTRLESIPAHIPYLWADAERTRTWSRVMPGNGRRVGLAWKGNPRFENDATRSLPSLEVLGPLGRVENVHFISLQKGPPGEDEARHPPPELSVLALGHSLQDFADTAAVMANLDLVISVDTAVAHLAGATGTPCWVLLPDYRTDWRWLTDRDDSPWYPKSMRLFRQGAQGGWGPLVEMVTKSLREWASESPAP